MATARGPYEPYIVGADIGNATTSVHTRPQGRGAFLPSFVAAAGVGPYEGLSKIATARHHVTYAGRHALVGVEAVEGMGGDSILGAYEPGEEWQRYVAPMSMYCLLAAVSAAFVEADSVGLTLATGAPLSLYQAHGEAIRRHYLGEHRYSYNGHERRLVVADVKVYGEGREVLRLVPVTERRGRIAVHDVGGRTWNVLFFQDGALKGARTFDHGIERIMDRVPLIEASAGGRWRLQAELRRSPKAHPEIRAALDAQIGEVLEAIEGKVRIDKADRHLLIGGGAVYLPSALKRRYGTPAQILNGDAPEGANAVAYALAAAEVA